MNQCGACTFGLLYTSYVETACVPSGVVALTSCTFVFLGINAFCSACTTQDVGLRLQAQGSLYMFSLCHDLSTHNKKTGYFGERIINNLASNQVSAAGPQYATADMMRIRMASFDHSLSYEWVNAYQESWEPYDLTVRLATAQSPCHYPG